MTKNLQMRINCKIYLTYFSHRQFSIVFSNQSRPCLPPTSTDWLKLVQKERKYNHHPWQMHGRSKAEGLTHRRGKLNFLDQLTWLYKWVEKFCFMKNEHRHTTLSSFCEISSAFKERAKLGGRWKPFFPLHFSNSLDSITNLKSIFLWSKVTLKRLFAICFLVLHSKILWAVRYLPWNKNTRRAVLEKCFAITSTQGPFLHFPL